MTGKKKRHSPEQIVRKLRDADAMRVGGKTIGQVVQALEISEQTSHRPSKHPIVSPVLSRQN